MSYRPSANIATFQNCGTERYKCLENKKMTAYIDVREDDSSYTATLQYGKSLSWVISTTYTSRRKKEAVLIAFDRIIDWIKGDQELVNDVCCPDILRPYKMKKNETDIPETPVQLSLF